MLVSNWHFFARFGQHIFRVVQEIIGGSFDKQLVIRHHAHGFTVTGEFQVHLDRFVLLEELIVGIDFGAQFSGVGVITAHFLEQHTEGGFSG